MPEHDQQQAELLHQYWERLHADPTAFAPVELDPDLARLARALEERIRPPEPEKAFATRLRERLEAQATATSPDGHVAGPVQRWPLAGFAAAAVLVFALFGASLWISRPQPVSAQEIIRKARMASVSLAADGIRSFELTQASVAVVDVVCNQPGTGTCTGTTRSEENVSYQAPGKWRRELYFTSVAGRPSNETYLSVADGKSVWSYDSLTNAVQVHQENPSNANPDGMAPFGSSLAAVLKDAATCYHPKVTGEESVANRPAYVVSLGATSCPGADAALMNGPQTIWVDQATFFVLKRVILSANGKQVVDQEDVTAIRYNPVLPASEFTFRPPPGAAVYDRPAKPTPLPEPTPSTLAALRAHSAYPIFVPTDVPPGFTPELPAGGIVYHDQSGAIALRVTNGPAGCCLATLNPQNIGEKERISLPDGSVAHFLENPPADGGPILWWNQDGTYIAISGPNLTRDDLLKIAASMSETANLGPTTPVTARPTPTPIPTPAFAILRPSWLPEPMTVREQLQPNPNGAGPVVTLGFDPRPNDKPHMVLTLIERPLPKAATPGATTNSQDPQATRDTIGGREVTIIHRGQGCVMATWHQDGLILTLTNPYDPPGPPGAVRYSCDQIRQVIASIR